MNQKNGRTDPGPLRERARSLFISQATIDETLEWATPRQLAAIDRMLATELANREASKRARLMRQARFPVPKSLDGYDFANVRLPDGYTKEQPAGLDFAAKAQDLVFYGKTGRGKTHLATALGMLAVERGRSVRFRQTAELVLQLGKGARREGVRLGNAVHQVHGGARQQNQHDGADAADQSPPADANREMLQRRSQGDGKEQRRQGVRHAGGDRAVLQQ